MGTIAKILCSNPYGANAKELQKEMIEQYGQFRVSVKRTYKASELEVSCTTAVTEEQFLQALQKLKEKYGIEEHLRVWWFRTI
jgi:hypothetical protein